MKHFKFKKGVLACLLSLALAFSCFSTVGIKAEEAATTAAATPNAVAATYNPDNDTVVTTGKVIYVLKAETGNTIKKGSKCYEVSATATENTLTNIGAKATNKDVFLYVCDGQFEETDGTGIKANLVIKAQAANKIVGSIDYTQADNPASTNVLTIKATKKDKSEIADAQLIWSEDGTTWKEASEFTGAYLAGKLVEGASIQVKMLGDATTRTSKAISVKIAKLGKAPKVKADVKKDTYSIKNGMDFALFTKNNEKYEMVEDTTWMTVLPVLKDAATSTVDASIVATNSYKPLDKKATNAKLALTDGKVSYTKVKIKALGYNKLASLFGAKMTDSDTQYYLGVRTSATVKKPASDITYFEFDLKAEAPLVITQDKVEGQYLVASGSEFAKKGFVIGTIENFNTFTGYDDSFAVSNPAGSGADTATAAYEFAVVKLADITPSSSGEVAIDWTSLAWKKLDPAKTKINGKLKSKYTAGTSKVTAELKAWTPSGTFTPDDSVPEGVTTVLLVRRAGVKSDSTLASKYQILYVVKNGSNFEIYTTTSVGEEAFKYTVDFYKWSASGESTYAWKKDDSLTVTGWGKNSSESAECTLTNADLFELTGDSNTIADAKTSVSGGKLAVEVAETGVEKKYAIREYANVEIVAAVSGETTTKTLVTITNGKSSISGDDTEYYVGKEIVIDYRDVSANAPSESGYNIAIKANVTSPATGFAKVNAAGDEISTTVNTAENTVIKVTYTKTPVTKAVDFVGYSNEDYDYEIVDNSFSDQPHMATYGVDVKFKVTAATGKNVTSVQYKIGSADSIEFKTLTAVNGVYTISGKEILDAVKIKVEVETASSTTD